MDMTQPLTLTKPKPLTYKQKQVLRLIINFVDNNGYPPTIREIAAARGCAVCPVQYMLSILRKNGYLTWEEGKPRTLRVLIAPED